LILQLLGLLKISRILEQISGVLGIIKDIRVVGDIRYIRENMGLRVIRDTRVIRDIRETGGVSNRGRLGILDILGIQGTDIRAIQARWIFELLGI
jgi:hypothetical protein